MVAKHFIIREDYIEKLIRNNKRANADMSNVNMDKTIKLNLRFIKE